MAEPTRPHEEIALIRQLQSGCQEALETIFQLHGGDILHLLSRRYGSVLSASDLDDVMAIALFRLWRGRERKQTGGSLRAWFFRIAENVARDVLRLGWHKARRLEVAAVDEVAPAGTTSSAEAAAGDTKPSRWNSVVREVVDQLPEVQRRIIWADAFSRDGPANATILAQELGIAASSVRVYRMRAMEKIRAELLRRGFPLDESRVCHGQIL